MGHDASRCPPDCFTCKVRSLAYTTGQPAKCNGKDRWGNDPVKQRIEELSGDRIDTDALERKTRELTF